MKKSTWVLVHDDPNMLTVDAAQRREPPRRFGGEQPVMFASNIPGRAAAGMVATATLNP